VRGGRVRTVLATLLLHRNEAVSAEQLAGALWGDDPPPSAHRAVHVHVSRLRSALGDAAPVATTSAGYVLRVGPGELDAERFEALVGDGQAVRAAGDPERAARMLREALALWRGPALHGIELDAAARPAVLRLEELRLAALEACMDAELELGRHTEVVAELDALASRHPTRERLAGQLMLALYRSGRQAEALDVYRRTFATLVQELGIEPGPALKALELAVLEQSPALEPAVDWSLRPKGNPPAPAAGPLPVAPTPTIGRERDIPAVRSLLMRSEVRLVTLAGPGGVGKTRLALEVARATAGDFPDGAWWVDLAGVARAEDVTTAIAHALSVAIVAGEDASDALHRFLADKRALLVLDNFEQVLDAAGLVATLLDRCRGLTVLATSREALDLSAEHRFVVAPLAVPSPSATVTVADLERTEGTAAFLAAARRRDNRFRVEPAEAAAIAGICARLDGLPLAIELAAARVGWLGPEGLLARLDEAVLAVGSGPRDVPDRQRTLRATIEWSHRLLEPEQQAAFRRFAVFAGGATLEAAQMVAGAGLETLEALAGKHLVQHDSGRHAQTRLSMLETVRAYAGTLLAQDPERDDIRRRHCEYYLRLVERTAQALDRHGERDALAVLEHDVGNIRAALEWALAADPPIALRMAGQMRRYWRIRAAAPEGLRWLDAALAAAGEDAPVGDQARAELGRSDLLDLVDDVAGARAAAERALELFRRAGDEAGMAEACCAVAANGLLGVPDMDLVRRSAHAAAEHARRAGDEYLKARALAVLTPALPPGRRLPALEEAAALLLRSGNHRELAVSYSNSAYSALLEGRSDEALTLAEKAMAMAEASEDPNITMFTAANLGVAALLSRDFERAREAFRRQLELCRQHVLRWQAGEGFAGLAAVAALDGEFERAARLFGAACAVTDGGHNEILERVEHDFIVAARLRYGEARWSAAERTGAVLPFEQAIEDALSDDAPAGPPHFLSALPPVGGHAAQTV
jgi:predicted ATPase/DNA-binding SARP family transcriptional activator